MDVYFVYIFILIEFMDAIYDVSIVILLKFGDNVEIYIVACG